MEVVVLPVLLDMLWLPTVLRELWTSFCVKKCKQNIIHVMNKSNSRNIPLHPTKVFLMKFSGTFFTTGLILLLSYGRAYGYLLLYLTCFVINYSLWSLNTQKMIGIHPFSCHFFGIQKKTRRWQRVKYLYLILIKL